MLPATVLVCRMQLVCYFVPGIMHCSTFVSANVARCILLSGFYFLEVPSVGRECGTPLCLCSCCCRISM